MGYYMIEWVMNNSETLIASVTGIVSVASVVAKLTPTKTDDKIVFAILKLVDIIALNNKPTKKNGQLK